MQALQTETRRHRKLVVRVRASENENFAPSIFTLLLGRSSVLIRVCKSIRYRCFKELYHLIRASRSAMSLHIVAARFVLEKRDCVMLHRPERSSAQGDSARTGRRTLPWDYFPLARDPGVSGIDSHKPASVLILPSMPSPEHLSEMADRIAKGLENVTKSARAADEIPMNADELQCFLSAFIRVHWCTHWIRPGKTTGCEKGLQENQNRTSPRRRSRTTSRRAGWSASKMSTGFCSPGNARP